MRNKLTGIFEVPPLVLERGSVYRLRDGSLVLITRGVVVDDQVKFWYGVNQRGTGMNFDTKGICQLIKANPLRDIVTRAYGRDNFKIFETDSTWETVGNRVWKILHICDDKEFPIVANKLLPDGSLHEMIARFNWDGQSLCGTHLLHKRVYI